MQSIRVRKAVRARNRNTQSATLRVHRQPKEEPESSPLQDLLDVKGAHDIPEDVLRRLIRDHSSSVEANSKISNFPSVYWIDSLIVILQLYFVLMNLTVERFYCHGPLLSGDTRPYVFRHITVIRISSVYSDS